MNSWQPTRTGADLAERFNGQRVSASYFQVLGVRPALGRVFQASEDRLGGPSVVILSDALWRSHFGSDSAIVGKLIQMNDRPRTVVGVLRAGEEFPPRMQFWIPWKEPANSSIFWAGSVVARPRPAWSSF